MKKKIAMAAFALCTTSAIAATSKVQQDNVALAGWQRIAEGVYRHIDENGVTTQLAYGEGGARYDAQLLSKQLDDLLRTPEVARGESAAVDAVASLESVIEAIPHNLSPASSVQPMSTDTGNICAYEYAFDSTFYVGDVGATAIARTGYSEPDWGPRPPGATSVYQYTSAQVVPKITGGWGTPISSSHTSTSDVIPPVAAIADWNPGYFMTNGSVTSARCKASTFSSISITSVMCTGGTGYVSQTKTYPTCVNTP